MLDVKELVWEITTRCNNGCDYCGSYCVTSKPDTATREDIIEIANRIAEYPPAEINISGGDPTLVAKDIHEEIIKIFRGADVIPKIVVNPLSMIMNLTNVFVDIVSMYDAIGISINTEDEYTAFVEHAKKLPIDKITFVTNFNKNNLWMFDKLLELMKKHNRPWQLQFTMFHDHSDIAIYESELAIEQFFTKVAYAITRFDKVVLGDNINRGTCTAGLNTMGICANGDVIPCLSMRSWVKDLTPHVQGNLHKQTMKKIWENGFKDQRFSKNKCCAQHCKGVAWRKEVEEILGNPIIHSLKDLEISEEERKGIPRGMEDIVLLYGIQCDNIPTWPTGPGTGDVMVYGVDRGNSVMVYAVVQDPPAQSLPPNLLDNPVWKNEKKNQERKKK